MSGALDVSVNPPAGASAGRRIPILWRVWVTLQKSAALF